MKVVSRLPNGIENGSDVAKDLWERERARVHEMKEA
jgi:hypothetical protein